MQELDALIDRVWGGSPSSQRIELPLEQFRKLLAKRKMDSKLAEFIEETKDVSGIAVVVLTPESITLLTDADGNFLQFS